MVKDWKILNWYALNPLMSGSMWHQLMCDNVTSADPDNQTSRHDSVFNMNE